MSPGVLRKRETGRCNCNPDLRHLDIREYREISGEKLTCKMCKESSKGEIRFDVVQDDSGRWERFWIEGGDMFYWLVAIGGFDFRLIICQLCMIDQSVEFPNAIEWTTIRGTTGIEARGMDLKLEEEDKATHDPESLKKLGEAQDGSYSQPIYKFTGNNSSEDTRRKNEVKINDEFVELELRNGCSTFIFAIDERGLPHFPERVKGQLPSGILELAQRLIHHKLWCAEIEGLKRCNCADPTIEISLWTASEDGED